MRERREQRVERWLVAEDGWVVRRTVAPEVRCVEIALVRRDGRIGPAGRVKCAGEPHWQANGTIARRTIRPQVSAPEFRNRFIIPTLGERDLAPRPLVEWLPPAHEGRVGHLSGIPREH